MEDARCPLAGGGDPNPPPPAPQPPDLPPIPVTEPPSPPPTPDLPPVPPEPVRKEIPDGRASSRCEGNDRFVERFSQYQTCQKESPR